MMDLLLAFLQQQNLTDGTFHGSYSVAGAGVLQINGMYYPLLNPNIIDQWGNLVYMHSVGIYLAAHDKDENGIYTFRITNNYTNDMGNQYYQYTGTCPQDVNNPIILSGGVAPFPTIQ